MIAIISLTALKIYTTLLICVRWIFISVWYEPTCVDKAVKPIIAGIHPLLTWTSPNLSELRAMYGAVTGKQAKSTHTNGICLIEKVRLHEVLIIISLSLSLPPPLPLSSSFLSDLSLEDKLSECKQLVPSLLHHIPNIVVSLGRDGVLVGTREEDSGGQCLHYPPATECLLPANVVSVTGAGDRWVWSLIINSMCRHIIISAQ